MSILLIPAGGRTVTVHPNATVYFANSTVHCYARGASPHDPVTLAGRTTSAQLSCEEPFPDPFQILGITVADAGG